MKRNSSGLLEITLDKNNQDVEDVENNELIEPTEEEVLLNSIHNDTSAIKSILSGKTSVEIQNLRNNNKIIENNAKLQGETGQKILKAINEQVVLTKRSDSLKRKLDKDRPRDTLGRFISYKNKGESLGAKPNAPLTDGYHDIAKNIINNVANESVKSSINSLSINSKNKRQAITNNTVNTVSSITNNNLDKKITSIEKVVTKTNKQKTIPKDWKLDKDGIYRDKKGRFINKDLLKEYGLTDNRKSFIDDDYQEDDSKIKRKVLDALSGIKEDLPDTENVDPMIDATKEVGDAVNSTIGIGKSVFQGFGAIKGLFSKDNKEPLQENKRFFRWFKKKSKKDNEKDKETQDTLEEIAKNGGGKSSNGGIFSFLGKGLSLKKLGALIGGGFGLKKLLANAKVKGLFKAGAMKGGLKGGAKRIPLLGSLLAFADGGIGGGLGALVGGGLGTFFGPIGTIVGGVVGEQIGKWLGGLDWAEVGKDIKNKWDETTDNISKAWDSLATKTNDVWNKTKEKTKGAYNSVKNYLSDKVDTAKENVAEFTNAFSSWDNFKRAVKGEPLPQKTKNIGQFNEQETNAYLNSVIAKESGGKLDAVNTHGYSGLYQMGASALVDSGMIKRKAFNKAVKQHGYNAIGNGANAKLHKAFLENPDNWTIKGGQQTFLNDKALQDKAMVNLTNRNYKQLDKKGLFKNKNNAQKFGLLQGAHLKGVGGVEKYVKNGVNGVDGYGTSIASYQRAGEQYYMNHITNNRSSTSPINNNTHMNIPKVASVKDVSVAKASATLEKQIKQTKVTKEKSQKEITVKKTENTSYQYGLSQLLTQDVSERTIAHIVNGGLSKTGKL